MHFSLISRGVWLEMPTELLIYYERLLFGNRKFPNCLDFIFSFYIFLTVATVEILVTFNPKVHPFGLSPSISCLMYHFFSSLLSYVGVVMGLSGPFPVGLRRKILICKGVGSTSLWTHQNISTITQPIYKRLDLCTTYVTG